MTTYTGVSAGGVPAFGGSSTIGVVSLEIQSLGTGANSAYGAYFYSAGAHSIYTTANGPYGAAVYATNTGSTGNTIVAYNSGSGWATIYGENATEYGIGVYGYGGQDYATGVYGYGGALGSPGVSGYAYSWCGIYGECDANMGVFGKGLFAVQGNTSAAGGTGVYARDCGYASCKTIWGYAYGTSSYALYATGPANVTGYLYKSGGGFRIDHPLDPANKYLNHSFVESPDMKNIYDGVGTADANGDIAVTMPDYFHEVNVDFRYQLTAMGGAAPDLHVKEEIKNGKFVIGGAKVGQKVSWQVTGIRNDPWAAANRMVVNEDKPAHEKGKYRHPEVYGKPVELWTDYRDDKSEELLAEYKKHAKLRPTPTAAPKVTPP